MFVTIINDCKDQNAFGRQQTRSSVLFNTHITTIGVEFGETIEGAGNIIDMLDAAGGAKGVILVNLAPRHGEGKKWENGTPFCYFYYKDTLVISSVAGFTLSLVKKFKLVTEVAMLNVPTVIEAVVKQGVIKAIEGQRIIKTQFRSFDFLPLVAKWILDGITTPTEKYSIQDIPDAPRVVWWVDNFGNCKTTILPEEIGHKASKKITTKFGEIACFDRLKDVPDGETALIIGSSGLGDKQFIELVVQGESAAVKFSLKPGAILFNS